MTAQELYDEYKIWLMSVYHTLDKEDQSMVMSISFRLERMVHAEAFLTESIQDQLEHFTSLKERYTK